MVESAPQPDLVSQFFNAELYAGIQVWHLIIILLLVGISVLIIKSMKQGKKNEIAMPKPIEPEKETYKRTRKLIQLTGTKVKYKSFLMFGMNQVGRIVWWCSYRFERLLSLNENNKRNEPLYKIREQIETKKKGIDYRADNFKVFLVIGRTPIHLLIWFLGNPFNLAGEKIFLVDNEFLKGAKNQYLNIQAEPTETIENMYVFSDMGQEVIQLWVEQLQVRQMLKSDVNRIPLIQYHDLKTAKFVSRADAIRKQKKKAWKDKEQSMSNQDMPDVEDEDVD